MGNSQGKDDSMSAKLLEQPTLKSASCLSSAERAERRYLRSYEADEAGADFADIDQTVDRYDYLIEFPHAQEVKRGTGAEVGSVEGVAKLPFKGDFVKLSEIDDIWYSVVPGDEVVKNSAREKLRREFEARFRTPAEFGGAEEGDVEISRVEWLRLAREVIQTTLYTQSGLQLKLTQSRDGSGILCRVRAPVSLLERQADRDNYRLQFRGEVDPGYDFWSEEEIAEEQKIYTSREDADEVLEKLYQAEKISPSDLAVFPDEATQKEWSRRVHTLERIADRVPVQNRFPAYAEFNRNPKERHLYQTYPSIRGRTLFRAKDRLILTKAIIDSYFDLGVLQEKGVVLSVTALHDANRGDKITREVLQKRWVFFWREEADRLGAPMVSMREMDEGVAVSWYLRAFSQPLEDVRDYFGEKLAFYFAWLGFYGYALIVPSLLCIGSEIYFWSNGLTFHEVGWDPVQVAVVVMIIVWNTIYKELWQREEKVVAVKWGTVGFEEVEKDRPSFRGDKDAPDGGRRRSPVTNTYETFFPDEKRQVRQALGLFFIVTFIVALCGAVQFVEWLEYYLEDVKGYSWGSTAGSVLSSVQIQVLSWFYSHGVRHLNELENYQTETSYEDNLIFKTFLFQMFNNYAALFYNCFIKGSLYGCSPSCVHELRELLLSIFIVRFLMTAVELGHPYALASWKATAKEKERQEEKEKDASSGLTEEQGVAMEEEAFESELIKPPYEGTFDDYAAIVLQYGYVTMFVAGFPAVVFLAMLEILLQIRVDSFKLVSLLRRPYPEQAEDVGMWSNLSEAMGYLSVFSNTAIICFTSGTLMDKGLETKFLTWLILEHALLGLKVILHLCVSDEPDWLRTVIERHRFIVQKHKHGFVRDDDRERNVGEGAGGGDNQGNLDIDGLKFVSKQKRVYRKETSAAVSKLRAELREVSRALKVAKEQLQAAYQNETFNDQTQIGETKHGLPLGCLNIKLIRLEGLQEDPSATSVIMSLRCTKQGDKVPPGPAPQASRPAHGARRRGVGVAGGGASLAGIKGKRDEGAAMEFNQVFVMAPVRTQDAEVVFDITVRSPAPKRIGCCRIPLRDLADQLEHDYPLTMQRKIENKWEPSEARLYCKLKFMYSKIVPLRNKIYALQDRSRTIEKDITKVLLSDDEEKGR